MDGRRGANSRVDREGGWGQVGEGEQKKPMGRQGRGLRWAEPHPQGSCSAFTPGPL